MKMVSQLTRQAMSRHRLLTNQMATPVHLCTPAEPAWQPPAVAPHAPEASIPSIPAPSLPTSAQLLSGASPSPPSSPSVATPVQPPRPARTQTIYQQLMKSHDRVSERHF